MKLALPSLQAQRAGWEAEARWAKEARVVGIGEMDG